MFHDGSGGKSLYSVLDKDTTQVSIQGRGDKSITVEDGEGKIGYGADFEGAIGGGPNPNSHISKGAAPERPVTDFQRISINPSSLREEDPGWERTGDKRKKQRVYKKKRIEGNLLLGMDVKVEDALEVANFMLVGRVRGRFISGKFLCEWVESQWKNTPANSFRTTTMVKGWFLIKFGNKEALEWVEARNWAFGKRPVFFKRWTPLFDANKETVEEFPVWVRAPGLPPFLWVDSVFASIGNHLGTFLEADMSFIETQEMEVARILVRLNPDEGLEESINLQYQEYVFEQQLDYELLPFRCHCCHEYGHLVRDCPLGRRRRRPSKYEDQREDSVRKGKDPVGMSGLAAKPMEGIQSQGAEIPALTANEPAPVEEVPIKKLTPVHMDADNDVFSTGMKPVPPASEIIPDVFATSPPQRDC